MRDLFGPESALASAHPAYSERPQQAEMAQAVATTLEHGGVLLCEAGTGTGKSLAYLAPAVLSSRRVIVSTATHALQSQLVSEDVPMLARALGRPLHAELLKGRSNYACKLLVSQLEQRLFDERFEGELESLRGWLETTETGDRAELEREPSPGAWREISVGPDRCRGPRCPSADSCFAERARQRAHDADVVIVNHALLFADLSVRIASDGVTGVLPEYDAVILDEAHELENVAAEWLGARFSLRDVGTIARETERACRVENAPPPLRLLMDAQLHAQRVFDLLPSGPGRVRLSPADLARANGEALAGARHALRTLAAMFAGSGEARDLVSRQAERLALSLDACFDADHELAVVWREGGATDCELRAAPIDVAPLVREHLWDRLHAAVLTSATLSIDGDLSFTRRRLGLEAAREIVLPSPFDIAANALLYLPRTAPDPREPGWEARIAELLCEIVEASGGRALCLFTSHRALRELSALVAPRLRDYRVLVQGQAPRERLLEAFRNDVTSVLFATSSFWQGVDVRGESLSCVIIDKLPFAVPSDPLVAGRCERIERDGGSSFAEYSVPHAALMLRQGFGRLLRAESDRGVVALLDGRVRRARYGRDLLAALPPAPITDSIEDVRAFFAGEGLASESLYAEVL